MAWRPSRNLPPVPMRDLVGIAIGLAGTAALILLAASCAAGDASPITGTCAARMLIALAAILLNLAHVVGLLLFDSVAYRGLWERFFARLTTIGTPIAVLVSALLLH
ncbi:MAG: hypothetical protein QOG09_862 [Solirubrobacterales bacterium]|nr:hypothetical protein [Solirubrobacterales bacterium]MDX6653110.1 hypothetical protein [Solirubrobacterales bacterium]MDX6662760.1 hypothetical protein [Solirubrobacterales bacterium]